MGSTVEMDARSSRCLLSLFALLLSSTVVLSQPCPAVDACLNEFVVPLRDAGHDHEAYCRQEGILINCLKKATCSEEAKEHKDRELRHFQTDGQCESASAIVAGVHILLVSTFCLLLNLFYR